MNTCARPSSRRPPLPTTPGTDYRQGAGAIQHLKYTEERTWYPQTAYDALYGGDAAMSTGVVPGFAGPDEEHARFTGGQAVSPDGRTRPMLPRVPGAGGGTPSVESKQGPPQLVPRSRLPAGAGPVQTVSDGSYIPEPAQHWQARPLMQSGISTPRPRAPVQATSTTRIPLATSSSILLHNGFWDLLSATRSRFLAPEPPLTSTARASGQLTPPGLGRTVANDGALLSNTAAMHISGGGKKGAIDELKKVKRVSVDMIGRPKNLKHLVHASDHEQAQLLLTRWHLDGVGKIGSPAWAAPIKEAARTRARAKGVAEVQAHRNDHEAAQAPLQVVNGLPESAFTATSSTTSSTVAVEDVGTLPCTPVKELPQPIPFPTLVRGNSGESVLGRFLNVALQSQGDTSGTTKFKRDWNNAGDRGTTRDSPISFDRPGLFSTVQDSPLPGSPDGSESDATITFVESDEHTFAVPSTFVPSLATIERAAAAKVYFETKYYAILRKPRDRDQRKALLEAELSRLNISDSQRDAARAAWALSETEYLRDMRSKASVGSFIKLKTIGHGAFGVVSLVKERGTGELYAMKQLRKADMLRKGQEGHVRAERDLLAAASTSTRWTVRLAYSFQDVDHLYLVMTFMSGGDLLTLLIEKDTFPESMARFYIAEMVLAISETHRVLGAIHRDVKPDNFLFDSNGHIAISDFGLASDMHWSHDGAYYDEQRKALLRKHGIDLEDGSGRAPVTQRFDESRRRLDNSDDAGDGPSNHVFTWRDKNRRKLAHSVVGTNNYMSVEVLRGTGYDQSSDWWSLGVILYEMLYGYPPFVSKSRQTTRQKIMNWRTALRFPPQPRISRDAQDLISSLICEREDRIGSRSPASVSRPNSAILHQRRGFQIESAVSVGGVQADGVEEIMAHPFFRGVDWANIHLQTPPFVPQLKSKDDTRYFEDDIDDNPLPAPEIAPGVPAPDTTRDPMLRHQEHGAELLEVRKALAFQGWTYKKPKRMVYDPRRGLELGVQPVTGTVRGRSLLRVNTGSAFKRALSV